MQDLYASTIKSRSPINLLLFNRILWMSIRPGASVMYPEMEGHALVTFRHFGANYVTIALVILLTLHQIHAALAKKGAPHAPHDL